jgi:hypothetical protein
MMGSDWAKSKAQLKANENKNAKNRTIAPSNKKRSKFSKCNLKLQFKKPFITLSGKIRQH